MVGGRRRRDALGGHGRRLRRRDARRRRPLGRRAGGGGGMTTLKTPPIPEQRDFPSRLHHPRVAARVGAWLGICFFVAFATGLISHLAQQPDSWLPSRPVWGYRLTQGLHVAAGTACVPLLLVKLWTVYPRFWIRPPRPSPRAAAARRRADLGRCARRRRDLPARHRAGQRDDLVPLVVLVPVHPLRRGLGGDRRPRRAHRRQAARRPRGPGRARRRGRASRRRPVAPRPRAHRRHRLGRRRPADGRRHRPVAAQGLRVQRPLGRRPAGPAGQQERPRGRGHGQRDRPGVPPRRRARRPVAVADPCRPPRDAADGGRPADRLRRGLERPRRLERRPAARPARPRRGAARVRGHRLVAPGARAVPR